MIVLHRTFTDPWFNLAAEEYLLKAKDDEYFMLWQNDPAVIVGKHQNALAEINYHFVRQHNIPVIRRITGGGTVYHDRGNLNFTFIQQGEKGKLVDFRRFIDPVIDVLRNLGLNAEFEGKNNIRIDGMKVSGNSEHVYRNKVLHHGTLLFNSDLEKLTQAIKIPAGTFKDKSVKSIRTRVANISEFLSDRITIDEFKEKITSGITGNHPGVTESLSADDIREIQKLVEAKYKTRSWNFGYSPEYQYSNSEPFRTGNLHVLLQVKEGKIKQIELSFPGKSEKFVKLISDMLIGQEHYYPIIESILNAHRDALTKFDLDPDILLKLFS